jgi:hypothetical protein
MLLLLLSINCPTALTNTFDVSFSEAQELLDQLRSSLIF